ncbi:MAG: hypothetical protein WCG42_09235, partial [Parachlamydiaceae bacterium]
YAVEIVQKIQQRLHTVQKKTIAVPDAVVQAINTEASFIGNLLSDRDLSKVSLESVSKRWPHTLPTLLEAREQFGQERPTPEQVRSICDQYIAARMVEESSLALSPFNHLSIHQWTQLFLKPESAEPEAPLASAAQQAAAGLQILRNSAREKVQTQELVHFVNQSPISIDSATLLHVIGDIFGKDTLLEGHQPILILQYLLGLVHAEIETSKKTDICEEDSKSAFCNKFFSDEFWLIQMSKQDRVKIFEVLESKLNRAIVLSENFSSEDPMRWYDSVQREVEGLAHGDTFFFPGGWLKHAIVYEVLKQENGLFTFRVYNTGEGLEYYARAVVEAKTHFFPFIEIIDIPSENLLNPIFLQGLKELKQIEKGQITLVRRLLPELGGTFSERTYRMDELRLPQQSGTCAYLSIITAFSFQFESLTESQHFVFEVQLKALNDYDATHDYEEIVDFNLVHKGVAAFAVRLDEWRKNNDITAEEQQYAVEIVQKIQQRLHTVQNIMDKETARLHPLFHPGPQTNSELFYKLPLDVPGGVNQYGEGLPKRALSEIPLNVMTWKPEGVNFLKDLEGFLGQLVLKTSLQGFLKTREDIKDIVLKISLTDNVFWNSIDEKAVEPLIHYFRDVAQRFVDNLMDIRKTDPNRTLELHPTDYLTVIKLLTFADKLSKLYPKSLEFTPPDLYQARFGEFLSARSLYFGVADPAWAIEASHLRDYWTITPEKPDGFFALLERPVGTYRTTTFEACSIKEVTWIMNWLQSPIIKKRIVEQHKEWSKKSIPELTTAIINEWWYQDYPDSSLHVLKFIPDRKQLDPGSIVPSSFLTLIDLSYLVDALLTAGA